MRATLQPIPTPTHPQKKMYPPVNKHSNGKSPSWIGNTSSNGGFSIAREGYGSLGKNVKSDCIPASGTLWVQPHKAGHIGQTMSRARHNVIRTQICLTNVGDWHFWTLETGCCGGVKLFLAPIESLYNGPLMAPGCVRDLLAMKYYPCGPIWGL